MKINQLIQNKIIKIFAMIGLLYFLFESTKQNPRAITNQISGQNLQKNIDHVSKKLPKLTEAKKLKDAEITNNDNQ